MIRSTSIHSFLICCISATAACQSPEASQREATRSQEEADKQQYAATTKVNAAKVEADESVDRIRNEAQRDAGLAQDDANREQSEANQSLNQTREVYRSHTQTALDGLVKRRQEVENKTARLVPAHHVPQDSLLQVKDKESKVKDQIQAIQSASASTVKGVKSDADRELAALRVAVVNLEGRSPELHK
jgi:hypothetical protein